MNNLIDEAMEIWREMAILREGKRNIVYFDSLGKPTVGIGHLVVPKDKLKVGDIISEGEISRLFKQDSQKALDISLEQLEAIGIKTAEFLAALISVNFQLGDFRKKFPNSFELLVKHNFEQVIQNLLTSIWYKQTPVRVEDFVKVLREQ